MPVKFSEYKGWPILELHKYDHDKKPFRFGLGKAKLILKHVEDIKKFVEENSEEDDE